jgi:hypothetical protein
VDIKNKLILLLIIGSVIIVSAQEILITIMGQDDLSPALDSAADSFAALKDGAEEAGVAVDDVAEKGDDVKGMGDDVIYAGDSFAMMSGEADNASNSVSAVGDSADSAKGSIDDLGLSFGNIDDQIQSAASDGKTGMSDIEEGASGAKGGVDSLTESFSSLSGIGGMALMMLGGMMEAFAGQCISAAESVQTSMQNMGASMGMSATQAIQNTGALENMVQGWSQQTGQSGTALAQAVPTLEMVPGMQGNQQLLNQSILMASGLAVETQSDPQSMAQQMLKLVSTGNTAPSSTQLAKIGINTQELDASTQLLGLGNSFASLNPAQKMEALNEALKDNSNIMKVNASEADSAQGRMNIFNEQLQTLEGEIGQALIPALSWFMTTILQPLAEDLQNPVFADFVAGILVLGGALGLIMGPLIMVGLSFKALGDTMSGLRSFVNGVQGAFNSLKTAITGAGDSAATTAGEEDTLATSEQAAGGAAVTEAGEEDTLAGSEGAAGGAGAGAGAAEGAGAGGLVGLLAGIGGGSALVGGGVIAAGAIAAGMVGSLGYNLAQGQGYGSIYSSESQLGGLIPGNKNTRDTYQQANDQTNIQAEGIQKGIADFLGLGKGMKTGAEQGEAATKNLRTSLQGLWKDLGNVQQSAVHFEQILGNAFKQAGAAVGNAMKGIENWVGSGINWMISTVQGGVNTVVGAFNNLGSSVGSAMQNMYNTIVSWTNNAIGMLKKLYCQIFGCSPGLIPAFQKLAEVVPQTLGSTLPSIKEFSGALGGIPNMGTGNAGIGAGSVHNHYHSEQIQIDASQMSQNELKVLINQLLVTMNKSLVPNVKVTGGTSS